MSSDQLRHANLIRGDFIVELIHYEKIIKSLLEPYLSNSKKVFRIKASEFEGDILNMELALNIRLHRDGKLEVTKLKFVNGGEDTSYKTFVVDGLNNSLLLAMGLPLSTIKNTLTFVTSIEYLEELLMIPELGLDHQDELNYMRELTQRGSDISLKFGQYTNS